MVTEYETLKELENILEEDIFNSYYSVLLIDSNYDLSKLGDSNFKTFTKLKFMAMKKYLSEEYEC
jgi:hypothetical protein